MSLSLVPLYAAFLAVLYVALSIRTIILRDRLHVALGDGGHTQLQRAVRVHANFAEYVPLALLLIAFAEMAGAHAMLIHILAAALCVGRCLHAYGVSQVKETLALRVAGMILTFSVLLIAAVTLVVLAL